MSNHEEEVNVIAKLVRALISSRKPPTLLNEILSDYKAVEGTELPFRKFGYSSARELLIAAGEFTFTNSCGGCIISAKASSKSSHIVSLVREQNRGKTRQVHRLSQRQPIRSFNYGGGDARQRKPLPDRNNNACKYALPPVARQRYQQQLQQRMVTYDDVTDVRERNRAFDVPSPSQSPPVKELGQMLNSKLPTQIAAPKIVRIAPPEQYSAIPRAILGQKPPLDADISRKKAMDTNNNRNEIRLHPSGVPSQQMQIGDYQQRDLKPHEVTMHHTQAETVQHLFNNYVHQPKPMRSVQNRLKVNVNEVDSVKGQASSVDAQCNGPAVIGRTGWKRDVPGSSSRQAELRQQMLMSLGINCGADPLKQLELLCFQCQYDPPRYREVHNSMGYDGIVIVNNRVFRTYPDDYPSQSSARFQSAIIAIDELLKERCRQKLPICTFTKEEILDSLYELLVARPCGIYRQTLPELFGSTYSLALPDDWWTLITESERFKVEQVGTTASRFIVYAETAQTAKPPTTTKLAKTAATNGKVNALSDNISDGLDATDPAASSVETVTMPPITLPWSEKYWDLHITHCELTTVVSAHLISNIEPLDQMMQDIEEHMKGKNGQPLAVAQNQIYLVNISESWHRVRVDELDKKSVKALCFFIDFGDSEWLSVDELHICDADFLRLPAQALPLSLFGLEDFANNPNARSHLIALLSTKSVIGEILTKEADFNANAHGRIQVVLWDTSTSEDINLNSVLVQQICNDAKLPHLKPTGITNVVVTHISDEGDLYVRIPNKELAYVENLIQDLVSSKFSVDHHRITADDLKHGCFFLICDDAETAEATSWHRGELAMTAFPMQHEEPDIFFIDSGCVERVHHSRIFRLESLSTALSKFPPQAIKVRLHNIPPTDNLILERLRVLLPPNCEAMVKVVTPADVPLVVVYKRVEKLGTVCTINDIIRAENELACANNDSDTSSFSETISPKAETKRNLSLKSVESSPKKLASVQSSPNKLASVQSSPNKLVSVQSSSEKMPLVQSSPKKLVSVPSSPEKLVSVPSSPEKLPSVESSPKKLFSLQSSPKKLVSVPSSPKKLVSVPSSPKKLVSVPTSPEKLVPVPNSPEKLVSVQSSPKKLVSVQSSSEKMPLVQSSPKKLVSVPSSPAKLVSVPNSPEKLVSVPSSPEKLASVESSPKKLSQLPHLRCYESIPKVGEYFEVRVTMSANPSNFTIQPYRDYPQLRDLMKELQAHCENNDEFVSVDTVEVGQAYAAKNPDGFYHRVIVVNMINSEVFHVSYCDFGDIAALSSGQLKVLPEKFRNLPIMAVKAKLHDIEPLLDHWTLDDCIRFRELTVGMKFVSIVKERYYTAKPENQILELEIIDVSTPEDVFIHETLLKEDRAIRKSQLN